MLTYEQLGTFQSQPGFLSPKFVSTLPKERAGSSKFPAEPERKYAPARSVSSKEEENDLAEELEVLLRRRELDFEKLAN